MAPITRSKTSQRRPVPKRMDDYYYYDKTSHRRPAPNRIDDYYYYDKPKACNDNPNTKLAKPVRKSTINSKMAETTSTATPVPGKVLRKSQRIYMRNLVKSGVSVVEEIKDNRALSGQSKKSTMEQKRIGRKQKMEQKSIMILRNSKEVKSKDVPKKDEHPEERNEPTGSVDIPGTSGLTGLAVQLAPPTYNINPPVQAPTPARRLFNVRTISDSFLSSLTGTGRGSSGNVMKDMDIHQFLRNPQIRPQMASAGTSTDPIQIPENINGGGFFEFGSSQHLLPYDTNPNAIPARATTDSIMHTPEGPISIPPQFSAGSSISIGSPPRARTDSIMHTPERPASSIPLQFSPGSSISFGSPPRARTDSIMHTPERPVSSIPLQFSPGSSISFGSPARGISIDGNYYSIPSVYGSMISSVEETEE